MANTAMIGRSRVFDPSCIYKGRAANGRFDLRHERDLECGFNWGQGVMAKAEQARKGGNLLGALDIYRDVVMTYDQRLSRQEAGAQCDKERRGFFDLSMFTAMDKLAEDFKPYKSTANMVLTNVMETSPHGFIRAYAANRLLQTNGYRYYDGSTGDIYDFKRGQRRMRGLGEFALKANLGKLPDEAKELLAYILTGTWEIATDNGPWSSGEAMICGDSYERIRKLGEHAVPALTATLLEREDVHYYEPDVMVLTAAERLGELKALSAADRIFQVGVGHIMDMIDSQARSGVLLDGDCGMAVETARALQTMGIGDLRGGLLTKMTDRAIALAGPVSGKRSIGKIKAAIERQFDFSLQEQHYLTFHSGDGGSAFYLPQLKAPERFMKETTYPMPPDCGD